MSTALISERTRTPTDSCDSLAAVAASRAEIDSVALLMLIRAIKNMHNIGFLHMAGHLLIHERELAGTDNGQMLMEALLDAAGISEIPLLKMMQAHPHLAAWQDRLPLAIELIACEAHPS